MRADVVALRVMVTVLARMAATHIWMPPTNARGIKAWAEQEVALIVRTSNLATRRALLACPTLGWEFGTVLENDSQALSSNNILYT